MARKKRLLDANETILSNENMQEMLNHLKGGSVQQRLQGQIEIASQSLTASIGQAAALAGVSIVQLRYWEKLHLLPAIRATDPDTSNQRSQRRYDLNAINRLLLIKELLDNGYSLTEIGIFFKENPYSVASLLSLRSLPPQGKTLTLNERIRQAEDAQFWSFFISRTLALAIVVLAEEALEEDVGLFIPLPAEHSSLEPLRIENPENLDQLGKSLVGWHARDRLFDTYLTEGTPPKYPEQFELIALDAYSDKLITNIHLLVDIQFSRLVKRTLPITYPTMQRLLHMLQANASTWTAPLQSGADTGISYSPNVNSLPSRGLLSLNRIAEMTIELGGIQKSHHSEEGQKLSAPAHLPRWRFACILLPNSSTSLYQPSLVIAGQSQQSPHKIGFQLDAHQANSLCRRAFQSGQVVYRTRIVEQDQAVAEREKEAFIKSMIALPIPEGDALPVAVLYVAADEEAAFSGEDQDLLRGIGKIIQELDLTFQARRLVTEQVTTLIHRTPPADDLLKSSQLGSENDFLEEMETQLLSIQATEQSLKHISLIAIDIDNHSSIAEQFGFWAARNLMKAVGQEIRAILLLSSKVPPTLKVYRVYDDRFYIILPDIKPDIVKDQAQQLHANLKKTYQVTVTGQNHPIKLWKFTTRLAVTSYDQQKLQELWEMSPPPQESNLRARLITTIDNALEQAKKEGGDQILVWDLALRKFVRFGDTAEEFVKAKD